MPIHLPFGLGGALPARRIEGERVCLHLVRLRDLPSLHARWPPEPRRSASAAEPAPRPSLPAFCAWQRAGFPLAYLVEERGAGLAGFAGLYALDLGRSACLSLLVFDPERRGHGLGREALALLLDSLAARGVVREARAEVAQDNVPALRLLAGAGFAPRGARDGRVRLERRLG